MRTWLAFDADWLGWLSPRQRKVRGQTVGRWARVEYGEDLGFSAFEPIVRAEVLPLHHGADSRRCLLLGEVDSSGEYPVLLADIDDGFYLGVEYPGIDVYLADLVGLVAPPRRQYGAYVDHPVYGARMREHAARLFDGAIGLDLMAVGGLEVAPVADHEHGQTAAAAAAAGSDDADMVEVILGRNPMTGAELTKWVRRDQVKRGQRIKS